jgi:phosphoglycolate phosphatase
VGFDLDMTLIDARVGMVAAFDVLAAQTGLPLDGERFAANLGPPLETEFRRYGFSESTVEQLAASYRALYPAIVVPVTAALPGAEDALAAVREADGRVIVVTAKNQSNAELHLSALGWQVDHVTGGLWAAGKADALREHGAALYVGDHVGDVRGAQAAGALPVAVASGPCDPAELAAAGAAVVLPDLVGFRTWFRSWLGANAEGLDNADGLATGAVTPTGLDGRNTGPRPSTAT